MDWLKDPKNTPKVAAGLGAIIVLTGVAVYFLVIRQPSADTAATSSPTDPTTVSDASLSAGLPGPGSALPGPGGAPTGPASLPGPGAAQPGGAPAVPAAAQPLDPSQSGSATPMEAWRSDPFLPLDYKPPGTGPKPKPRIEDFPFVNLGGTVPPPPPPPPDMPQPPRRMAGVLVGSKIYAIIETNGEAEIVQPGDTLKDRLAVVERIERDKVVLKTKDPKPKYLVIRMAASPKQPDIGSATGPGSPVGPTGPTGRPPMGPGGGPRRPMSGPEMDFD